jgi:hypothetical protein
MRSTTAAIAVAAMALACSLQLGQPRIHTVAAQSLESHGSGGNENSLQQQIVAREREGLDALKTGDLERFGNLTAEEAVFVDTHGPAGKAQVLKNTAGFTLTDYTMEDVHFVPIAANTGLISYKITEKGVSHGKEFAAVVYVSSVWAERREKWVCLFSQETAAR